MTSLSRKETGISPLISPLRQSVANITVVDFQGGKEFHWTPPQRQHVVAMYARVNKTTDTTSQQHVSRLQRHVVQVSGRLRSHFDLKRTLQAGGFGRLSASASLRKVLTSMSTCGKCWTKLPCEVTESINSHAVLNWRATESRADNALCCVGIIFIFYLVSSQYQCVPDTESISPIITGGKYFFLGFPKISS